MVAEIPGLSGVAYSREFNNVFWDAPLEELTEFNYAVFEAARAEQELEAEAILEQYRWSSPVDRVLARLGEPVEANLPSDETLVRLGIDRIGLAAILTRGMKARTFARALKHGLNVDRFNRLTQELLFDGATPRSVRRLLRLVNQTLDQARERKRLRRAANRVLALIGERI